MESLASLVRPLEPSWQKILDSALKPARLTTADVARLAPKVEELSRAYNTAAAEGTRTRLPIEARIAFSFPRDVPKGAAAVRELIASGALVIPEGRPLRIVDLGAGLGAMTWGVVRALAASGADGRVEALLVDEDADVLERASAIARAAREGGEGGAVALTVSTRKEKVAEAAQRWNGPKADLVILGQVLSELDPSGDPEARLASQSAFVARVLETLVADDGSLLIVEPALRERTRHLHALRDRLLGGERPPTVFAPCLHAAACPALASPMDWCHEDLAAVDLPGFVVPLARAAGLRWQGLTFSYLVLRKDGRVANARAAGVAGDTGRIRFRVTSDLIRTKGKVELFACAESGLRTRIRRLDRDAGAAGAAFAELRRGDVVTLTTGAADEPPVDERGRVSPNAVIDVAAARK